MCYLNKNYPPISKSFCKKRVAQINERGSICSPYLLIILNFSLIEALPIVRKSTLRASFLDQVWFLPKVYHLRLFLLRCALCQQACCYTHSLEALLAGCPQSTRPQWQYLPPVFYKLSLFSSKNTNPVLCKDCEKRLKNRRKAKYINHPKPAAANMNVISKGLVRMFATPAMLLSPFSRFRKAGKTSEIFMPPTQKVAYFLGVRSIRKATTEGDNPTIRGE